MRKPSARSVACKKCGAEPGKACRTRAGRTSFGGFHTARREAFAPLKDSLLRQLARDIVESFSCGCADTEDGECPCGGDGPGDLEGCWHCQARAALSDEDSPQPAPAPVPAPTPIPAGAGAAIVEEGRKD